MYYNKDEFLDEFLSLLIFSTTAGYKKMNGYIIWNLC